MVIVVGSAVLFLLVGYIIVQTTRLSAMAAGDSDPATKIIGIGALALLAIGFFFLIKVSFGPQCDGKDKFSSYCISKAKEEYYSNPENVKYEKEKQERYRLEKKQEEERAEQAAIEYQKRIEAKKKAKAEKEQKRRLARAAEMRRQEQVRLERQAKREQKRRAQEQVNLERKLKREREKQARAAERLIRDILN